MANLLAPVSNEKVKRIMTYVNKLFLSGYRFIICHAHYLMSNLKLK